VRTGRLHTVPSSVRHQAPNRPLRENPSTAILFVNDRKCFGQSQGNRGSDVCYPTIRNHAWSCNDANARRYRGATGKHDATRRPVTREQRGAIEQCFGNGLDTGSRSATCRTTAIRSSLCGCAASVSGSFGCSSKCASAGSPSISRRGSSGPTTTGSHDRRTTDTL